jgi:4-hydroxy-tetrahydrodipicolinate synthase
VNRLRGTFTALVTPFHDRGVEWAALERLVERQIAAGVDGLVPCGTTGESPTLTHDEHDEVIARVIKLAAGRVPVIAGTGSNSTAEAVRLSRRAVENGADALLSMTPYYNKPSQAGIYEHFAAVARAVDKPIVLYNIPGRCGVAIGLPTILRLRAEFPHVNVVKHATGGVADAAGILQSEQLDVLSGDDPITLPLMSIGACGVISVLSNLVPAAVTRLTKAALADDWATAREQHRRLFPLAESMLGLDTNPVPIKTALAMYGLCGDRFRLPMCPLSEAAWNQLQTLLATHLPALEEPGLRRG